MTKPSPNPPLLSTRAAVIFLLGILCGSTVATLTYLASANVPGAILAGLTTIGGAIPALHKLIG